MHRDDDTHSLSVLTE